MKLTAEKLFGMLEQLKNEGNDLSRITITYRYDDDSDVHPCQFVEEDLYDSETNNILESIIIKTK
jgi:hypothetical protein